MAAGLDALREAGIPLVQTWRRTSTGKFLPDRWMLPESLRDETGVVFASAFPGFDRFADEMTRYFEDEARRRERASLEDLRRVTSDPATLAEIDRKVARLDDEIARKPYAFDRRFLFRVLSMGHSQFAEYVGARGPNTQVNSACASTAQAIGLAEDWIRSGRCRRVLVLGADAVTSDRMLEWIGAGFLASGAAATDDKVEEAALPFDRRRHGTLIGMGACALVVESQDAVEERGMRGLVELLSTETRNSAFHGTRLDVDHISDVVESLVASAERRFGLDRHAMASEMVFMSHETFTPARGGSAAAEVVALRHGLRAVGERNRRREHERLHRPPDGGRHRGRHRRQDPRARHRPAGPELPGARSRPGRSEALARRPVSRHLRDPPRGRLRVADLPDADAPHPRRARPGRRPGALPPLARGYDGDRRARAGGRQTEPPRRLEGRSGPPAGPERVGLGNRPDSPRPGPARGTGEGDKGSRTFGAAVRT